MDKNLSDGFVIVARLNQESSSAAELVFSGMAEEGNVALAQ